MEENRLVPMKEYDIKVFKKIYKDTVGLRRKLAREIDYRRFGVDYNEILSWFDVKFIFTFNKYNGLHEPDILKGHIIIALKLFKCRILRKSYSMGNQINVNSVDISLIRGYEGLSIDNSLEYDTDFKSILASLRSRLSENSRVILDIELNTPEYIIQRTKKNQRNTFLGIPSKLLADYLGFDSISEIETCKKEILQVLGFIQKELKIIKP